jgi:beta-glucosidase
MRFLAIITIILGLGFLAFKCAPAKIEAPGFFFGASNAAFQVEGSPRDSDWREWTRTSYSDGTPHISDISNAERVTDFWNRYDEDFQIAEKAGLNAFRISIAWERIEPEPGVWDEKALDHYVKMIVAMRRRGLEPFVTLHHYVMPLWVSSEGGVTWKEFPRHFGEFSRHVVERLGKPPANVTYFMTINEPNILVRFGYLDARKFPPGINDASAATRALAGLAKAHIEAYRQIKALGIKSVRVGLAHNWQIFEPLDNNSASDRAIAQKVDWIFNRAFMDAIMTGDISFSMPFGDAVSEKVELPYHRPALDYLGVQNYGRSYVTPSKEKPGYVLSEGSGTKNDLGWELVPEALYLAVKQAARYGFPVIITETGLADKEDRLRSKYLEWNFAALRRLLAEKTDLFGYIHWSLTDNFEWAFGLGPRFGLVDIDYQTLDRKPRPSLSAYAALIKQFKRDFPNKHGTGL